MNPSIYLWPLALGLAGLAFGSAFSHAGGRVNPVIAARIWPSDGNAGAAYANLLARGRQASGETPVFTPQIAELARHAYASEPLNGTALRLLAQESDGRNPATALSLLEAGHRMSRRNIDIQLDLIRKYAGLGDNSKGLIILDQVLRRETSLQGQLLTLLASGVARNELLGDYQRLLAIRPPWSDQFWRQLAQHSQGIRNAATLRQQFGQDGGVVNPEVDRLLVSGLAQAGFFEDADQVAHYLVATRPDIDKTGRRSVHNIVRNADFGHLPQVPPLDWELASAGDYGSAINSNSGRLVVSAIGGARGVFAQQLVRLEGSSLRFSLIPGPDTSHASLAQLGIALTCAENGALLYSGTGVDADARLDPGTCRWAWLRLSIAVDSGADGVDIELDEVRLTQVRAQGN